jgi:hypothetical protein
VSQEITGGDVSIIYADIKGNTWYAKTVAEQSLRHYYLALQYLSRVGSCISSVDTRGWPECVFFCSQGVWRMFSS